MTLSDLIEDLEGRLATCGGFTVVTFRKTELDRVEGPESEPIVGAYADDPGEDIILRVGEGSMSGGTPVLTLRDLLGVLKSLQANRGEFEVECSCDELGAEWRLDLPLAGIAENSPSRLIALVTA